MFKLLLKSNIVLFSITSAVFAATSAQKIMIDGHNILGDSVSSSLISKATSMVDKGVSNPSTPSDTTNSTANQNTSSNEEISQAIDGQKPTEVAQMVGTNGFDNGLPSRWSLLGTSENFEAYYSCMYPMAKYLEGEASAGKPLLAIGAGGAAIRGGAHLGYQLRFRNLPNMWLKPTFPSVFGGQIGGLAAVFIAGHLLRTDEKEQNRQCERVKSCTANKLNGIKFNNDEWNKINEDIKFLTPICGEDPLF